MSDCAYNKLTAANLVAMATYGLDANGGITQKKYDALYLTEIIDATKNKTTYQNDECGRPLVETDFYGTTYYTYDLAGRLKSVKDRNSNRREYDYDTADHRIGETWKNTGGTVVNSLSWSFNADGQLSTATQGAAGYTFDYDDLGRLKEQTDPSGYKLTWTYLAGSDLVYTVTNSHNGTILGTRTYTYYDATSPGPLNPVSPNNVKHVTFTAGSTNLSWKFFYNKRDDVTEIKRYSDLVGADANLVAKTTYGFDPARRLDSITHKRG